jgi:hypothetical protein
VFGPFPGATSLDTHFAPNCGAGGGGGFLSNCGSNGDCQGGLCYLNGGPGFCTNPCRTQDECGDGNACQVDEEGNDVYSACFPWQPNAGQGASCGDDNMCRGAWCDTGQCTNICFTDADCTVVGWRCIPQASSLPTGNYLLLACGP